MSAGESSGLPLQQLTQTEFFGHSRLGEWIFEMFAHEVNHLAHPQRDGQGGLLRRAAESLAVAIVAWRAPKQFNRSAGGAAQAFEQRDKGGFTGSVRTEQAENSAGFDREAHVIDGENWAEAPRDMVKFSEGCHP